MGKQVFCIVDYETRSEADLKKVGAWEYSKHISTRLLCASWRLGTREELAEQLDKKIPAKKWSPYLSNGVNSAELYRALQDSTVIKVAHNAGFEQAITTNVLTIPTTPVEWLCTSALAATHALPRKLEGATAVLKCRHQKDMEGHKLMLKMSKPRKATKDNTGKWHNKKSDLLRLMEYCATDVDGETEIFLTLPPLTREERGRWVLDQKINQRGFLVDRELVKAALTVRASELKRFTAELQALTQGEVQTPNQTAALLLWLAKQRHTLPNLQAKTVADEIAKLPPGRVRRVLEIRAHASKSSTKKWDALDWRTRSDGWLRDILVYHAASTGRWGGAGLQPQNLPRPKISYELLMEAISIMKEIE